MFLSNPAKSFLAVFLIIMAATGCGWLNPAENTAAPAIPGPNSRFPFKTKEPENFQCEIVQTAGGSARRTRLARKANWLRIDFDFGEKHQRSVLRIDKEYLIDNERRVYAEKVPLAGNIVEPQYSDLTHELLFANAARSKFEEIGREGGLIKYRMIADENDASESILYYDPSIGLPVRHEFFSISGEERSLEFSVDVSGFATGIDDGLFAVPAGFRKISLADFN
ncbi:MAG: hypothetical protein HOP17_06515 [Acidobacteria bacterium]|nr:hypothetical protein [Acidobacteriota bacterium]